MRCSNCGGQVVVPNVAAPFFSCSYCHATLPNPAHQHAALSLAPPAASGGKLKYALVGGSLVLLGAGMGPVAMSLLAAPASSSEVVASAAPTRTFAPGDPLAPAVAVPAAGNAAAAPVLDGKHVAAPTRAGVPAAAALAQPPTAGGPVPAAAAIPANAAHPSLPTQTTPSSGGTSSSSSTASTAKTAAVTVPTNVHVSMGSPSIVRGTYPLDAIRSALSGASGSVRACYVKYLPDRPDGHGNLPVSFTIQSDGTVAGAGVSGFVDVAGNTISCINRTIGGLRFSPSEGSTRVQTTISLSQG
jgi:hypothetical protein